MLIYIYLPIGSLQANYLIICGLYFQKGGTILLHEKSWILICTPNLSNILNTIGWIYIQVIENITFIVFFGNKKGKSRQRGEAR